MERIEFLLTDTKIVKALAHPLRGKLLLMLDGREASPSQLSQETGEALGTVSYHVRTLHDMGLIKLVGEKRQRGAVEHYYTGIKWAIPERTWKDLPKSFRSSMHRSMLSHIVEDISSAASSGGFDEPYSLLNRDALTLDEEGKMQLAQEVSDLAQRALALEAESEERLKASGDEGKKKLQLVLMLFDDPEERGRSA